MPWVAGVDGCRAGWFVVVRELDGDRRVSHYCLPCFCDVLHLPEKPEKIAVDMCIGLLDQAVPLGRVCDNQARTLLGVRGSSVFSPPVRAALTHMTYPAALAANRASSPHRVGISNQCFNLFPKLRDVDRRMTPARQEDVKEVHPELCFLELNGGTPMPHAKDTLPGMADRKALLLGAGFTTLGTALTTYVGGHVQTDDILDAYAACWTAERVLRKAAIVIPAQPLVDSKGLRMEMWR